jgi:hypothetical protein
MNYELVSKSGVSYSRLTCHPEQSEGYNSQLRTTQSVKSV